MLSILALASVVASIQSGQMSSKTLAVLGALAAVGAVLRFLPGPAGFSALFFLPILAGYAFGAQFGFLAGLTTLLASAFLTGGVGPWLPYQMFAAGWIGAAAGLLPHPKTNSRRELLLLAATGLLLGLLYGVVMNLWFWPFVFQPAQSEMYWEPGAGISDALKSYSLFLSHYILCLGPVARHRQCRPDSAFRRAGAAPVAALRATVQICAGVGARALRLPRGMDVGKKQKGTFLCYNNLQHSASLRVRHHHGFPPCAPS